ncbi:MAG: 16S rRNA (cytosine(1402)-N(4))-methyltransferase RsmH [Candidatus Pacebacteria bacterium]|nr:16S rRNA (cytosine(1402)-N(4))-methyltransferase RsmH [Candidatus Paceibacterota bacterium]
MKNSSHITVMLKEAVDFLQVKPGKWYVDATFGRGGHTGEILSRGGKVIAFDFDQESINRGQEKFTEEIKDDQLILVRENFDQLATVLKKLNKENQLAGVLFDFGTSTDQLMSDNRGFSFENPNADLDMRMDNRLGVKASDLLKVLTTKQLAQIFKDFGGEDKAKSIAKNIEKIKEKNPNNLETVGALVEAVNKSYNHQRGKINPATKVFQALRIVVNDEINNIEKALPQALANLKPQGRIVTIGFHEGEDRIAKQTFNLWEQQHKGQKITDKALKPSVEELTNNPRSRSAKLRVFERSN